VADAPDAVEERLTRRALRAVMRVTGLTATGVGLVVLSAACWALARFIGGRPLFIISYGLLAVLGVAYGVGRRPPSLVGDRSGSRPRLAEGEIITMEVRLTAERRLSTFLLEERVPPALGEPSLLAVPQIEPGEDLVHTYDLSCRRRGVYEIGPLVVRYGDPLGLTRRETVVAEPTEVLVHPGVEDVIDRVLTRMFEDPPQRPPISRPWPTGMEFYGMRKYQPGDDIRRIVWRAYARTGQLLVKEAEQGITDKVVVLLDQDRANHSPGEVSASFEAGVKVVASLGVRHLSDGYSLKVEGSLGQLTPPLRGGTARMSLLDALARVERVDAPLTDAIARLLSSGTAGSHLVFVTPRLTAEAVTRIDLLLRRGSSVVVVALLYGESVPDTLARAAALGCQVVEVRPRVPLSVAFRREVGAGAGGVR
jgi:uncharacterized protein (DUF58 family)